MGQEFWSSVAGWIWFRHLLKLRPDVGWGCSHLWSDWGWRLRSKIVHLHGCWQEALVTLHEDLSAGQPELCHAVVAGVPDSKQSKRPEQTLPGPLWLRFRSQHCSLHLLYWLHGKLRVIVGRTFSGAWILGGEDPGVCVGGSSVFLETGS